jgi:hypothetical protein
MIDFLESARDPSLAAIGIECQLYLVSDEDTDAMKAHFASQIGQLLAFLAFDFNPKERVGQGFYYPARCALRGIRIYILSAILLYHYDEFVDCSKPRKRCQCLYRAGLWIRGIMASSKRCTLLCGRATREWFAPRAARW